ncbi:SAV_6107 family HEPN domain-containing protein [Cellulomonas telluris]|uniref:SAV_6107 family HEPN domain-containing protein n=1 Tax=Cellulomonas telluris TaxID=2306636 RepID=UPI0010A7BC1F|nr:SAV_6107 family HEPN domain-containing protein [Cellulomonas telluris]
MTGHVSVLRSGAAASAVPPQTADLLARADAELLAAQFSGEPWEKFSHAHLAALRAGAGLVAARGRPAGRGAPRTVWGMLDSVAPEVHTYSAFFAQSAPLRSAVDAGRFDLVSEARAERALCAAEDLVDAVRALLAEGADGADVPHVATAR